MGDQRIIHVHVSGGVVQSVTTPGSIPGPELQVIVIDYDNRDSDDAVSVSGGPFTPADVLRFDIESAAIRIKTKQ